MQQKERFIRMWKSNDFTFSALCKSFEISRPSGYKLIGNYSKYGEACFAPRSTKPTSSSNMTPKFIEDKIIELRKKYPNWGARKFKVILEEYFKEKLIPSETTINAIMKRNDLVKNRRKRSKSVGKLNE